MKFLRFVYFDHPPNAFLEGYKYRFMVVWGPLYFETNQDSIVDFWIKLLSDWEEHGIGTSIHVDYNANARFFDFYVGRELHRYYRAWGELD